MGIPHAVQTALKGSSYKMVQGELSGTGTLSRHSSHIIDTIKGFCKGHGIDFSSRVAGVDSGTKHIFQFSAKSDEALGTLGKAGLFCPGMEKHVPKTRLRELLPHGHGSSHFNR